MNSFFRRALNVGTDFGVTASHQNLCHDTTGIRSNDAEFFPWKYHKRIRPCWCKSPLKFVSVLFGPGIASTCSADPMVHIIQPKTVGGRTSGIGERRFYTDGCAENVRFLNNSCAL